MAWINLDKENVGHLRLLITNATIGASGNGVFDSLWREQAVDWSPIGVFEQAEQVVTM